MSSYEPPGPGAGAASTYYNPPSNPPPAHHPAPEPQMQYAPPPPPNAYNNTYNPNNKFQNNGYNNGYGNNGPNYNGAPAAGGLGGASYEKQSFEQVFEIPRPKWNDVWAGILVCIFHNLRFSPRSWHADILEGRKERGRAIVHILCEIVGRGKWNRVERRIRYILRFWGLANWKMFLRI